MASTDKSPLHGAIRTVLNPAVEMATTVAVQTLGAVLKQFDDYSMPAPRQHSEERLEGRMALMTAVQADPADGELHYQLARTHQERLEFSAARVEYEMAELLGSLTEDRRFYYAVCLVVLGEAESVDQIIDVGLLSATWKDKYPEHFSYAPNEPRRGS